MKPGNLAVTSRCQFQLRENRREIRGGKFIFPAIPPPPDGGFLFSPLFSPRPFMGEGLGVRVVFKGVVFMLCIMRSRGPKGGSKAIL